MARGVDFTSVDQRQLWASNHAYTDCRKNSSRQGYRAYQRRLQRAVENDQSSVHYRHWLRERGSTHS